MTLLADVYTYDDYIFTHSFNVTLYTGIYPGNRDGIEYQ
ncbi:hypothetical protein SRABI133_00441 [Peribacillus simplex]|uniref:Uncharacterized protein n=1 Tax=Peribacillus simplex TaxID=1478 RepID=A0A9W4PCR9_9BACI|nr:hypothetical protein SRABI133_00441 [Peribacillus simplex]